MSTSSVNRLRIIFMGTPAFALPSLKALHASHHEVVAVYTQPPRPAGRGQKDTPSPVHVYAQENRIPVYTPTTLKSPEAQAEFKKHDADVAVVVAYGLLLPKPILEAYRLGCVNVHPSLLPRWRGAAPIQRTIMAGDRETGIVIMQMDEGLDTGPMLLVEKFMVPEGWNAGQLHDLLAEQAALLLLSALEGLAEGRIVARPQPEAGVTYAKKITREECHIDWRRPAEEIRHLILGLNPTPGAYFTYNGENIKIIDAACTPKGSAAQPGTVIDDRFSIACGDGIIHPAVLQRPGKKRMTVDELRHGFAIAQGARLS